MKEIVPHIDQDFLKLIRAALWQKSDDCLSHDVDWKRIYRLATEQTLQGIVADGLSVMGVRENMSEDLYQEFFADALSITQMNLQIEAFQRKLCRLFEKKGICYRIVKGLESARNYPDPYMRCAGDIDVLLPMDDFTRARELLAPLADREEHDYVYAAHKGYYFGDVEVELHGTLHPDLGDRIDLVIDRAQDDLFAGKLDIDTFNAFYIFLHCIQHIHFKGVGLRQIMDWTMLLDKKRNAIDFTRLKADLEEAALVNEWRVFMTFAEVFLGLERLEPSIFTYDAFSGASDLWAHCIDGGNMGLYTRNVVTTDHFLFRKFQHLRVMAVTYFATRKISPELSKAMFKRELTRYTHGLIKLD